MNVNTDIWGAPETWVDGDTTEQKAAIKYADGAKDTYKELYDLDNIPLNEIDVSPTFWGIGAGSIWCKPQYLSPYESDGETKVAVNQVFKTTAPLPIIFTSDAGSATQHVRYDSRYAPLRTTAPNGDAYAYKILLDFNYTSFFLVPYVRVKVAGYASNLQHYSLYDYMTNARYNTYPQIVGIAYETFLGDGVNENRSHSNTGFCSPVDYQAYDLYYDSKFFWCQQGCQQLLHTTEISTTGRACIGNTYTTTYTSINSLIGDATTALAYKYSATPSTSMSIYYYDPNEPLWQINKTGVRSGVTVWYEYPYIEVTAANAGDVTAYVLSQIAYIGLPFVLDPDKVLRGQIGDVGVYLPVFDNDGVTTGEYKTETDALLLPNSQWTDGRQSGYDPDKKHDDTGDTGDLDNRPSYQWRYANPNSIYALTEANFIKFVNDVNGLYLSDPDDTQLKIDFKGSNPNDYIIGAYGVPFLCNYIVPSGPDVAINLGPVPLPTAQGKLVDASTSIMRDCGTVTIPAQGNFLDYEPYTQIELYVPMCGTIQLDAAQVIGRTIHVIVYYDVNTMNCTAAVFRNAPTGETLIHTINGSIGASLPLTASRMGDYQNAVKTTENAIKQNEMRTALGVGGAVIGIAGAALAPETGGLSLALAGAAIAGVSTAASGAMTNQQLQYDLTHKQPAVSQCSAANGATAQMVSDLRPWLFIKRAFTLDSYDAAVYARTVGHACCINTTVGETSGLTVCANADLSGIPATATEIDMIRQKLQNGIYV